MRYLLYTITFLILASACTERMDVTVDSTYTRLTVEGKVTTDKLNHFVILSESSDVFFNETAVRVTNAQVQISDGETIYNYTETAPGYYESDLEFSGTPGTTYQLKISNVDIDKNGTTEEYLARETMPEFHAVDSIKMHFDPDYDNFDDDEGEFWLASVFLTDDATTEDYYGFASRINNRLVHDTITEVLITEDTYFNGKNSKGVDVSEFNQSEADQVVRINDEITLETYAITEEYHDFIEEFQEMDEDQSPMFSGPPANISTNLSNGAIGYFAVYAITRTTTIVKDE